MTERDPAELPSEGELPRFDELPARMRVVLVADDNHDFRQSVGALLAGAGFAVLEAENGGDALRVAMEHRPWLILSDVRMDGLDGLQFCRKVRRHTLLRHTPFIFLSGWDDYSDRVAGLEAGADEFLSKLTPARELLLRVHLLMKRFADLQGRDRRGAAMHGRLEAVSVPALLQMCNLAGLSGTLTLREGSRRAVLGFAEGRLAVADSDTLQGEDAVYDAMGWKAGSFDFQPGDDPGLGTAVEKEVEHLLLEGCRILDEVEGEQP